MKLLRGEAKPDTPERLEQLRRLVQHWHREIVREVGPPVAFSVSVSSVPEVEQGWQRPARPGHVAIRTPDCTPRRFDLLSQAIRRWHREIELEVGSPVEFTISVSSSGETRISTSGF
jgi:hypothetical protein